MTARTLRANTFAALTKLGFRPATSLPPPEMTSELRATDEVAARLFALYALFLWVAYPAKLATTARIKKFIKNNELTEWFAEDETPILALSRTKAHKDHVNTIGWRLENMWALAWVLGFEPEPDLAAAQMGDDVTGPLLNDFLPNLDGTLADFVAACQPRSRDDVIAMEYRFYCAHNAVRSAQLGGDTVPEGFHPILHGGAVHERRHSLTWCITPDVSWDDTDLST